MGKNAKEVLQRTAWEQILKYGLNAIKVQDICQHAGVSKMTFYYYYKNKHELVEEVLQAWIDELLEQSKSIIFTTKPFSERIIELVRWKAELVKTMSPDFVKELYSADSPYMHIMKDLMQRTRQLTCDFFQYGKDHGEVNKNADIPVIMTWMNVISDMIIEGKFNHLFEDPTEMNKQIRDLMLYGILGNTK